jgi:hypothetical protein
LIKRGKVWTALAKRTNVVAQNLDFQNVLWKVYLIIFRSLCGKMKAAAHDEGSLGIAPSVGRLLSTLIIIREALVGGKTS